jgi:hypothetical protein
MAQNGLTSPISSAGPADGLTCFLYSGANCTGSRSNAISTPGYSDLRTIQFDKKASSFLCYVWAGW